MWIDSESVWMEGKTKIACKDGNFWHVAPTVILPDGPNIRLQDLAMTLHNAKVGKGRVKPMEALFKSLNISLDTPDAPLETHRTGVTKEVEELLESVRLEINPVAPSRMACYFVSASETTAKKRQHELRGQREVFRCRILEDGPVHVADITIFDRLQNRLCPEIAKEYWDVNDSIPTDNREILVGGSLYFDDWSSFKEFDADRLSFLFWIA